MNDENYMDLPDKKLKNIVLSEKTSYPFGWICPRCQTVHSPFVISCNCPPNKTYTFSGVGASDNIPVPRRINDDPSYTYQYGE